MSTKGDDDGASSHKSGGSGTDAGSATSSQRSDAKFLKRDRAAEREEGDLLEQKRSVQEGIFACMYTLVRQSALSSWKFAVLKIILEGLMGFIVVFNPSVEEWVIDTNNPVWQVVRWTVWRSPIMRLYGYDTYIIVMYVMAGLVVVAVAGLAWLTMAMRKQEQSKWLRFAALALHVLYDVVFMMFYVSFFDYMVFTGNCYFSDEKVTHVYFTGVMCLEMPHLLHMCVGIFTAVLIFLVTALMVVASCDLNPISRGYLASPAAYTRLKILVAKAIYIIVADDMQAWPKPQALFLVVSIACIVWWNFRSLPFYRTSVNTVWCSNWMGILYTGCLLCYMAFAPGLTVERRREVTLYVLYGIWPVIVGSWGVCYLHAWWALRDGKKFVNLEVGTKIQKIHKFGKPEEVALLARVMRKFNEDGDVEEAAAALGEAIIKGGMQVFPGSPFLQILYANFLLEVKKDGPSSRTQLQLASKHSPSLVERYQIYCTYEASKRLKDSQDGGMDLQAYIEFRRNFRAVLRVHKEVLLLQTEVWLLCLRTVVRVGEMDKALESLDAATARAHQVYKRVIERYPTNGKLLRCYGKFLEDAKHDTVAASRAYSEASRNGGGDAIMNLDLTAIQGAHNKPEFLTSMSMEDDAVLVINAEGCIMMTSQAVQRVFGYAKQELEGANVSLLMPQPFSQRHNGYLQRYTSGGEPHILDSVREVVALHKERYVMPMNLCVTKMSGTGTDSVFLGVCRPMPVNALTTRAWISPNGVFLCGDQMFASLCGVTEGDLVGRTLVSLSAGAEQEVESLLEKCKEASAGTLASGLIRTELLLKHRYLEPVHVNVTVSMAGTDTQRILVLNCQRADGAGGDIIVVDSHMRLRFASFGVAILLGYPMRRLASMRLDQLLPPPYNTLHAKFLRDPPLAVAPTSCRANKVVHLLNENGSTVPVRVKIHSIMEENVSLYVVEVEKVPSSQLLDEKRLVVSADFSGRVLSVSPRDSTLFDFPAADLLGASLCDTIDIFTDWRERNGTTQLQLLMLALLDKEQEMPGTSWRVRVRAPATEGAPHLPEIPGAKPAAGASKAAAAKSSCMQVELEDLDEAAAEEEGEGGQRSDDGRLSIAASSAGHGTRIRVTLWRRDLLTGVLEVDDQLIIRRANMMTGLIVGVPASALGKKPIQRFLSEIPEDISWDKLTAKYIHHKRSALKGTTNRGTISPVMAFVGPHPDSGTMRIIVQGVQVMAPGGRPKITMTLHPDTAFAGAHVNLIRVLHLEGGSCHGSQPGMAGASAAHEGGQADDGRGLTRATTLLRETHGHAHGHAAEVAPSAPLALPAPGDDAKEAEEGGSQPEKPEGGEAGEAAEVEADSDSEPHHSEAGDSEDSHPPRESVDGADEEAKTGAALHRRAASKSDFVAQWVKTLSTRKASGTMEAGQEGAVRSSSQLPDGDPADRQLHVAKSKRSGALPTILEGGDNAGAQPGERTEQAAPRRGESGLTADWAVAGKQLSRSIASPQQAAAGPAQAAGGSGAADGDKDKWEKGSEGGDSSADGSQAASGITSVTDQSSAGELVIDSRRLRMLKTLQKIMGGPMLMIPLDRLRLQTYALLAIMFVTHIICYVIVTSEIKAEHLDVQLVHRQALAMDRSQLIAVRAMMGAYCERENVTAKVGVCSNPLEYTLGKLHENVMLQEEHHQYVYYSGDAVPQKLEQRVYKLWTNRSIDYHVYLDTDPPKVMTDIAGVWTLGNRYIAAAREAMYWLPALRDKYRLHRSFNFLVSNGLGPLFTGYSESLDLLVDSAWASVDKLRITLIILLAVEALAIQIACVVWEWWLVSRMERARILSLLAMIGLPGPILRQMSIKEVKVLDDSSDDDDDDSVDEEERQEKAAVKKDEAKGVRHAGGEEEKAPEPDGQEARALQPLVGGKSRKVLALEGAPLPQAGAAAVGGGGGETKPAAQALLPSAEGIREQTTDLSASSGGSGGGPEGGVGRAQVVRNGSGSRKVADAKKQRIVRVDGMHVNGKTLVPSYVNTTRLMLPFVCWNIGLIVIYAISLVKLNGMQGPLASLNMASHIIFRYTRIRAIAFGFVSQDDIPSRELYRDMLVNELRLFESEYNALMYGGTPASQMNAVFNHPVPASTFASSSFATEFFRTKRCFRYEPETCLEPGDEYYEVTHNGLDVMVRRMLVEMQLISEDDDADVVYNSTRYNYMFFVGARDLYEGLQQAAQLFVDYSIARYNEVATLHTILLVVSIALVILFVLFVLWPYLARLKADAMRVAALLSHVPPENLDVRVHVRTVCKKALAGKRRRNKHAAKVASEEVVPVVPP